MRHSDNALPNAPRPAGTHLLDARLHLLDRQLLDAGGEPVGIVDDLELEPDGVQTTTGAPASWRVSAILTGQVLFTRIFGGQPPRSQLQRLPWHSVVKVGTSVHVRSDAIPADALWIEHWLRDKVIGRIPGGRHAAQ